MPHPTLTAPQIDALSEICHIGMGNAATALSQLMGKSIHLEVPRAHFLEATKLSSIFPSASKTQILLQLQIVGGARGNILIVFPHDNAEILLENLLGKKCSMAMPLPELEASALMEVGNILASAYLNALGSMLKMPLLPSVPHLTCAYAAETVTNIFKESSNGLEQLFLVETIFSINSDVASCHFYVLPDPHSLELIIRALGLEAINLP
jgi:chemotaxis protein CheC